MGIITLYEGNGATQDIVGAYPDDPFEGKVSPNDKAKSLKLNDVRPGCRIIVLDSPNASTEDDFCIIDVKKHVFEYVVGTFERSFDDDTVRVTFIRNNGLDGRVSYIKIQ
jgi:hypothetical protein